MMNTMAGEAANCYLTDAHKKGRTVCGPAFQAI